MIQTGGEGGLIFGPVTTVAFVDFDPQHILQEHEKPSQAGAGVKKEPIKQPTSTGDLPEYEHEIRADGPKVTTEAGDILEKSESKTIAVLPDEKLTAQSAIDRPNTDDAAPISAATEEIFSPVVPLPAPLLISKSGFDQALQLSGKVTSAQAKTEFLTLAQNLTGRRAIDRMANQNLSSAPQNWQQAGKITVQIAAALDQGNVELRGNGLWISGLLDHERRSEINGLLSELPEDFGVISQLQTQRIKYEPKAISEPISDQEQVTPPTDPAIPYSESADQGVNVDLDAPPPLTGEFDGEFPIATTPITAEIDRLDATENETNNAVGAAKTKEVEQI